MKGRRGTTDGSTLIGALNGSGVPTALNVDGSGNLKTSATVTPAANQRVNAQSGDIAAGAIVDGADVTQGLTTDTAVTSDANGTVSGKLRGLIKILADVWDSVNHRLNTTIQVVAGTAIAVGNNAVPVLNVAATGYVVAFGSNPAALTANADALFKWGAGGTTQVNHIMIQNNTIINVNFDLDVATSVGSPLLAPGQTIFLDVQTTAVHLQTNGTPNLNGTSAGNIVVRGWL